MYKLPIIVVCTSYIYYLCVLVVYASSMGLLLVVCTSN